MFIRWKKRKRSEGQDVFDIYLVKSERIDGKPRQKVLASLYTIESKDLPVEQPDIWGSLEYALQMLKMEEVTRERLFQDLAQKTPRPSPEAIQKSLTKKIAQERASTKGLPKDPPLLYSPEVVKEDNVLFIKWGRDMYGDTYYASLAKRLDIGGEVQHTVITSLATIEGRYLKGMIRHGDTLETPSEREEFWYQAHRSLCKAKVDYDTYHTTVRLLSYRVQVLKQDEMRQLVQKRLTTAEKHAQSQINAAIESFNRWDKRKRSLQDMRAFGEQYYRLESSVSEVTN
jgi:hypothetical protein